MYKTIKIPEQTYKDFVKLKRVLEKKRVFKGLSKIKLNHVVGYAAHHLLEEQEKEKRFQAAAGSWADLNTDMLIKEIYESRKTPSREFML